MKEKVVVTSIDVHNLFWIQKPTEKTVGNYLPNFLGSKLFVYSKFINNFNCVVVHITVLHFIKPVP